MFSTGLSSGGFQGRKIGVMLAGMSSMLVVCQPARSINSTACAPGATRPLCWRREARAPRRFRAPDKWRRRDRRFRSVGRRVDAALFRVAPIVEQRHSSGRCALHPGTRFRPAFPWEYRPDERSRRVRSFFESLNRLGVLPGITRAGADVREADPGKAEAVIGWKARRPDMPTILADAWAWHKHRIGARV